MVLAIFLISVFVFSLIIMPFILCRFAYKRAFYFPSSRPVADFVAKDENEKGFLKGLYDSRNLLINQEYEPIYIKSYDNLLLFARYYHIKDNAPLFIEFHGYKGEACRDFSGGDMVFKSLKYNTLLVDLRAHGKSQGNTISFGIKERHDCISWVEWARARFGDIPIFLVGISMGASTVLMASDLDLPNCVKGIIADCAYSSPGSIIKRVCKGVGLYPNLIYPFIVGGAFIFGHFNLNAHSPVKSVKNTNVPILLLHGEKDTFVPPQMSGEIYQNCNSEKYLFTFKGAGHGFSFASDVPRYEHLLREFILNQLGKQNERKG